MTNNLYIPMLSNSGSPLGSTGSAGSSASLAPTPAASPVAPLFETNATLRGNWNLRVGQPGDAQGGTEGKGAVIVALPLGERVHADLPTANRWSWTLTSPTGVGRGQSGWVKVDGLAFDITPALTGVPVTSVAAGINVPLKPAGDELLASVQPSATARRLATVWNAYGGFIRAVAVKLGIDYRAALSVFVIEAGSRAYDENGRMIVRCEAHLLERWGGDRASWSDHFTRDAGAQSWVGHKVRFSPHGDWISYHGNNTLEWQVIDLASQLFGREVAARATSMGLPQVLGDNWRASGYSSAAHMLAAMQASTHCQIAAHFDYVVRAKLVDEVQREDWTGFARSYNGGGQAEMYGRLIASTLGVARQLLRA